VSEERVEEMSNRNVWLYIDWWNGNQNSGYGFECMFSLASKFKLAIVCLYNMNGVS